MRRRRRENSLLLKASKILPSLGASVNLTLSHRRRALQSFPLRRQGAAGSAPRPRETLMQRAPVARLVSVYHLRSNRESAPMKTASFLEQVRPVYQYVMKDNWFLHAFLPHAREETPESRGMPCLFLNTERGFGGRPPKKSGFRQHLAGSKMPKAGSKMPKETSRGSGSPEIKLHRGGR